MGCLLRVSWECMHRWIVLSNLFVFLDSPVYVVLHVHRRIDRAFKLIHIVGFTSVCYASCAPTDGTFKVLRIVGFTSVCCCEHIIQYCYDHRAKLAKNQQSDRSAVLTTRPQKFFYSPFLVPKLNVNNFGHFGHFDLNFSPFGQK